jgi:hypothetical protein
MTTTPTPGRARGSSADARNDRPHVDGLAVSTRSHRSAAAAPSPRQARRGRVRGVLAAVVAVAAVAVGFLVGRDGSPTWQVTRVLAVAALACAAVYAVRRAPRWVYGLIAVVVGIVATAVGAGIGLPHLSKVGWSPVTAAGLVTLAAGGVLLVAGAATIGRGTRRWWRPPVLAAILAVTAVCLWSGIQAVAATNAPRTAVRTTSPADRGLSYREVSFPTSDGVRLSGWYVPSTNRAAVVLLHGAGSTRSDVLWAASR